MANLDSWLNDIPAHGQCQHFITREKRLCDNPASWTAEWLSKAGEPIDAKVCQLHARLFNKTKAARIRRILPIGELAIEPVPELPHCPNCGSATAHPVIAEGKRVCPFCQVSV